jgi:hypothetical protein
MTAERMVGWKVAKRMMRRQAAQRMMQMMRGRLRRGLLRDGVPSEA